MVGPLFFLRSGVGSCRFGAEIAENRKGRGVFHKDWVRGCAFSRARPGWTGWGRLLAKTQSSKHAKALGMRVGPG